MFVGIGIRLLIAILMLGGLAGVGAAGYYGYASSQPPQPETIEAPATIAVTRTDVDLTVTAPGSLIASNKQTIRPTVAGQLISLTVQAGESVRAGDVVAE